LNNVISITLKYHFDEVCITSNETEELLITHADCINVGCPGVVDVITCSETECPIINERKKK